MTGASITTTKMPEDKLRAQGARCMDCGIPFAISGCLAG